jgi:hypothetical protein
VKQNRKSLEQLAGALSVLVFESDDVPGDRRTAARSGTAPQAGLEDVMRKFLKTAGAATLMGVLATLAVTADAAQIRAQVPFSFEVNHKVLPAGTYTVDTSVASGILVRGETSGAVVMSTPTYSANGSPKLVFHRYGDEYILREVWLGTNGKLLPESKRERELAQAHTGTNTAKAQRVEVPLV